MDPKKPLDIEGTTKMIRRMTDADLKNLAGFAFAGDEAAIDGAMLDEELGLRRARNPADVRRWLLKALHAIDTAGEASTKRQRELLEKFGVVKEKPDHAQTKSKGHGVDR
jgi:hypothetical protein